MAFGAAGLLWAAIGRSQVAPEGDGSGGGADASTPALQEVVVTALRRNTDLQKTPVSIAALSGDTLSQTGAVDFIDFASSVPGFTVLDDGPGQRRPIIRGIEGAGEGEVGIYYDEFPISGIPGATNDAGRFTPDIKLIDVKQVEVLRGPQGTLFGAGSEGGTIQTILNKPDLNAYSGYLTADDGKLSHGTESVQTSAVANLPVIDGVLGVRLVGYQLDDSGFIDNTTLQVADINRGKTDGGRIALRYAPTRRLTIDLLALYNHAHYDAGNEAIASLGDLKSNVPAYDPLDDGVHLYGLTARYRLGFADVTLDASSYTRNLDFNFTFPGLPIPWANSVAQGLAPYAAGEPTVGNSIVQQPQNADVKTYEARLNAPDPGAALQWTLGGFYQDRSAFTRSRLPYVSADGEPDPLYPLFQNRTIRSALDQRAVYGEVSYDFFRRVTVTGGARWAKFNASSATAYQINTGGAPGTGAYTGREYSSSKPVGRLSLSYQITGDLMAYGMYSEGFRAGGANQAVAGESTIPTGYGPDTVTNYEGGLKSQWLARRLTVNVDYYHMVWKNIQVQGSTPDGLFRFTTNAGQANSDGVEFDAHAFLTQGLELGLTYGWTFARLTKSEPVNPGLTESGYAGDRLPDVPTQQLNFSADYNRSVTDTLALRLHGDYQYVGWSQNLFSPYLANPVTGAVTTTPDPGFARLPGYSVVDLRASLQTDRWSAAIYANNLLDRRGETNVLWDSPFTPGRYTYYITPRLVGLTVTVHL
jgi:iron complex outermembrane recepter protein